MCCESLVCEEKFMVFFFVGKSKVMESKMIFIPKKLTKLFNYSSCTENIEKVDKNV